MQAQSLGQEDIMEKERATYSRIPAKRIPWTEEPGGLQTMGSQRAEQLRTWFNCIATRASEGKFFISSSLMRKQILATLHSSQMPLPLNNILSGKFQGTPTLEDHRIINSQVTGKQKTSVKLYFNEQSETKSREVGTRARSHYNAASAVGKEKNTLRGPHGSPGSETRCEGEEVQAGKRVSSGGTWSWKANSR